MSREEELSQLDLEGDGDAVDLEAFVTEEFKKKEAEEETMDIEHLSKTEDFALEGEWVVTLTDIKEDEGKGEKTEKDSADHDKTEQEQHTASDGSTEGEDSGDGYTHNVHKDDDSGGEMLSNDELNSIAGDGSDVELEHDTDDEEFQTYDFKEKDKKPDQKDTAHSVTEKVKDHTSVRKSIKDGETSTRSSASSDKAKHGFTKRSLTTLQNKMCIPGAYFGHTFDKDSKKKYCVRIYKAAFCDIIRAEFLSAREFCASIYFSKLSSNKETVELCTTGDEIHKLLDIILFMPWTANHIDVEIEYTHKEFPRVQHKATFRQRNFYARMTLKKERTGFRYQVSKSNSLFISNLPRGLPKLFLAALFPKGYVGKMGSSDGSAVVHLKNSRVVHDHLVSFYDFSINGKKLELRAADISQEEILRDVDERALLKKRKEQKPSVRTGPSQKKQNVGPQPDLMQRRDPRSSSAPRGREPQSSAKGQTHRERDTWRRDRPHWQDMLIKERQKHIEKELRRETMVEMEKARELERQQELNRLKLKEMERMKEMERWRKAVDEMDRQREAERIHEIEFQREQRELERLKEMDIQEMKRRKEEERQREIARQRGMQERERLREIERQRELQEMERQEEMRRQREMEERERLREIERQAAQELERLKEVRRQREIQEMELQREMQRQQELKRLREAGSSREMERQNVMQEMRRMKEMERQQELKRIREAEKIREMERLREIEMNREIERQNQELARLVKELDSRQGQQAQREMLRQQQQMRGQEKGRHHRNQKGEQRHVSEFEASQEFGWLANLEENFRRGKSEMPRSGRQNSRKQDEEGIPGTSRGREGFSAHDVEQMAGRGGWKEDGWWTEDGRFSGQHHDVARKRRFQGQGWDEVDQQPRKRGYSNPAHRDSVPVNLDDKKQLEMEVARETQDLQSKLALLNRLQKKRP